MGDIGVASLSSPIGLIAGGGSLPLEFIEGAARHGLEVVVVAYSGETDPAIEGVARSCTWIRVGQLGKLLRVLRSAGVRQAAFAGGIRRTRLLGGVRLDWQAVRLIARLGTVKDDALLRGIAGEVERSGIVVIAPNLLLARSVPTSALLTRRVFTSDELNNALVGWDAAHGIGLLDIGQTVVVAAGIVVAVEAVEGTDRAIARAGELGAVGGVVVKLAKPQQDLRVDLPAVGPDTMESMHRAGLRSLVVEAGKALLIDPQEVLVRADRYGIAIVAARSKEELRSLVTGGHRAVS